MRAVCVCVCVQRRLARRALTPMSGTTMRTTQLPILLVLGSHGEVSVARLAEAVGVDGATLGRTLNVLRDRGLIRIAEHDGHVAIVSLTCEGSRVRSGALAHLRAVHQSVVGQFGPSRLTALHAEIDALAAAVSD